MIFLSFGGDATVGADCEWSIVDASEDVEATGTGSGVDEVTDGVVGRAVILTGVLGVADGARLDESLARVTAASGRSLDRATASREADLASSESVEEAAVAIARAGCRASRAQRDLGEAVL